MIATSFRALVLLCGMASLGSGCAALNIQKPTASLNSANVRDVTSAGLTVDFDVNVQNPNAFEVPVSAADYKLALGGVKVVDDRLKPTASVPAKGAIPVKIPVRLKFEDLLAAEQSLAKSGGNIPYQFDGALEFSNSAIPIGGPVRVPLNFKGTLPLGDAVRELAKNPAALLQNPAARKIVQLLIGGGGGLGDLFNR